MKTTARADRSSTSDTFDRGRARGPRRAGRASALLAVVALSAAACGSGTSAGGGTATSPPPSASATPAAPGSPTTQASPTPAPVPTGPVPTTVPTHGTTRTEAPALAAFLTAAQHMDVQLRSAAALINHGIGPTTLEFPASTVAAITAISPASLVPTIPAGLPPRLQQRVLLVFSVLEARRYAFNPIFLLPVGQPVPRSDRDAQRVLEGLGHGTVPAARFASDLAATRTLAHATPAVPPSAPNSRAAAALAVQIAYIRGRNQGCGGSGGWVETQPVPLVWSQSTDSTGARTDGTIAGIVFSADYHRGQGWDIRIHAC